MNLEIFCQLCDQSSIFVVISERDDSAYQEILDEKKNKMLQLQKELDEQKAKLDRCQKQNAKLSRELRNAANTKSELPEEVRQSNRH